MKKILLLSILLVVPSFVLACQFDTDCYIGSQCIKPSGSIYGYCMGGMKPGNNNDDKPAYDPMDMTRKEGNTCSFDLDCGIGSSCYKSGGSLYGTCLKN